MKILFDLGHPAHFHLFKNFIIYLKFNGHYVDVVCRDKDVIKLLLKASGFNYFNLKINKNNIIGLATEFLKRTLFILKLQFNYHYNLALGTSVSIGILSLFSKSKNWNFNEDDDEFIQQYIMLAYPFATKIINPDCLRFTKWKDKRVLHNSYHELAYLHPNNFTPDENILQKYGLEKKKYVVLRLNSLKAHHDVGAKGISPELYDKIKDLLKDYTIIESKENAKTHQIDPWDMHHILAFAKMIISDSQTMTIESAVLGIPAVRINTFIGKSTVIDELEQKYKLAYGYFPNQINESLNTIKYLINSNEVDALWQERRKFLLSEKCDFNQWMIDFFEKEINK